MPLLMQIYNGRVRESIHLERSAVRSVRFDDAIAIGELGSNGNVLGHLFI